MSLTENPIGEISDNLLVCLKDQLNNEDVDYEIPLAPLLGGFDTDNYHFKLKESGPVFSRPLMLKLFNSSQNPSRAIRESVIQNALAKQEFPTATVHFTCSDKSYLGGVFIVMELLPGRALRETPKQWPTIIGHTTALLHSLNAADVLNQLLSQGLEAEKQRFKGVLSLLSASSKKFPWLEESMQWLNEHRPPEPENLVVCHNDLHAANILMEGDKVTAVLDWSMSIIADPLVDVARMYIQNHISSDHHQTLYEIGYLTRPAETSISKDESFQKYIEAYENERPIDLKHFDYYRTKNYIEALLRAGYGDKMWSQPSILKDLINVVYEVANIRVKFPG